MERFNERERVVSKGALNEENLGNILGQEGEKFKRFSSSRKPKDRNRSIHATYSAEGQTQPNSKMGWRREAT
jgi:hypothetical protein